MKPCHGFIFMYHGTLFPKVICKQKIRSIDSKSILSKFPKNHQIFDHEIEFFENLFKTTKFAKQIWEFLLLLKRKNKVIEKVDNKNCSTINTQRQQAKRGFYFDLTLF